MKLLLTQEALAKELGVSYATICRWEKDNREPQIVSQGKSTPFAKVKESRLKNKGRGRIWILKNCISRNYVY